MSTDGRRVFFESAQRHLFMRDMQEGVILQLDKPEAGAAGGSGEAKFQGASADGSKAFFKDTARLTIGASSSDLYMCEMVEAGCRLKDLTAVAHAGEGADVLGAMIGSSTDGSYLYFVANGVLSNQGIPVAGATPGSCKPELGGLPSAEASCNLYVSHDGVTSLVAGLSARDFPDWEAGTFHDRLGQLTARVSPNGRFLAFMSQRSLTGYDNHDAVSGAPDEEVFLFDAASGRVVCASCNPTGARAARGARPERGKRTGVVGRQAVRVGMNSGWPRGSRDGRERMGKLLCISRGICLMKAACSLIAGMGWSRGMGMARRMCMSLSPKASGAAQASTSSGSTVFVREDAGSPVDGCVGLIFLGEL